MTEAKLYVVQRLSAALMAPLVLVHLGMMIYAIQGGISSAEILSRTQGSFLWACFYGLFVIAVSLHACIGLRNILKEWSSLAISWINRLSLIIGLGLFITGIKAVVAVVGG